MNPMGLNLKGDGMQWQDASQAGKLQQLQSLNKEASDDKKLKKAAQEFEAIFVQQLLEAMDKTIDRKDSVLSGGSAEQYFRSMLNEEIAKSMSMRTGGSGFGLAETIYRQMRRESTAETNPSSMSQIQGQTSEVE